MASTASELISEHASVFAAYSRDFALVAVIVYEHLLTLQEEIELSWRSRLSATNILFLTNRYCVLGVVMFHVAYFTSSDSDLTGDAIEQLQFLVWPIFNGLCTFALSNKSWVVGTSTFLLSLVRFAISITLYGFGRTGTSDPIYGCVEEIFITDAVFRAFSLASRICLIAADLVLLLVIWRNLKQRLSADLTMYTMSRTFLHDGTIHLV
ncbi:hypothetical protein OH76DRAFT_1401608 [Lentinus brumalis]|uniref:DUF6533 domain-containing protein n=1 Tax=Lentinus brumalis TaxID=2498619 RepID=A0A371DFG2_9APHY|nr:hypothetical protein OH76DRAFT_1401608 [Polyporus brumalis]